MPRCLDPAITRHSVLVHSLPASVRAMERIPLHLIFGGVTFGDPDTAIRDGRYRHQPHVAANPRDQSITFGARAHEASACSGHARHPHR